MVDWQSKAELEHDAAAFSNFIHVLLGLYIWEWFTTLDFEFGFLTRKRRFRWPLLVYFLNRYSILAALIGITVSLNVTKPVNCQSLYTYNQLTGNLAIGLASVNLSLRTMAVYSQSLKVVVPLCVVILGHWALLLRSIVTVKAQWTGSACTIISTDTAWLSAIYIYTMCFDLIVTLLLAVKLWRPAMGNRVHTSRLTDMVFGDGLIYFLIAFVSNLIAVIFIFLNLNAVMSVIAEVPAAVATSIVACRVVRRLANFSHGTAGAEIFSTEVPTTTLKFESAGRRVDISSVKGSQAARNGLRVQMHSETVLSMDGDIELSVNTRTTGDTTHVGTNTSPSTSDFHKHGLGKDDIAYSVDVESELQYETQDRVLTYDVANPQMYNDAGATQGPYKRHQS